MSVPLPARPNLEFERKRAKKMLRALHDGEDDAVARAKSIANRPFHLADAQLIIAREYGFASWPRLAQYYNQWATHERAGVLQAHVKEHLDFQVDALLKRHARGGSDSAVQLATFIPRFYGCSDEEIIGKPVTREDAQLVVARMARFPNWEEMYAVAPARENLSDEERVERRTPDPTLPGVRLHEAFKTGDLHAVQQLIHDHPELGQAPQRAPAPMRVDPHIQARLLWSALYYEAEHRTPESRAISDWVESLGFELVPTLTNMLMHCFRTDAAKVAHLLERGADPNATAPTGLSVLDIAVLKYWNGDAVDHVARRATPRQAFWMAAGLGDLDAYKSYLGPNDTLLEAARTDRPDWLSAGLPQPTRPNASDDMIIWDTWIIAGMNQRFNIMDYLLSRGWPVDAAPWGSNLLSWADANRIESTANYLRSKGAR